MTASQLQKELGQKRPFTSLETEVFLNMRRSAALLADAEENILSQYGLTIVLYNVLRILRGAGEPMTCSTVAARLITRVPDLTRLADRLVKKGYIRRFRTEADRRRVLLDLTDKGRKVLGDLDEPIDAVTRKNLGHLSKQELETLNTLLVKARDKVRP